MMLLCQVPVQGVCPARLACYMGIECATFLQDLYLPRHLVRWASHPGYVGARTQRKPLKNDGHISSVFTLLSIACVCISSPKSRRFTRFDPHRWPGAEPQNNHEPNYVRHDFCLDWFAFGLGFAPNLAQLFFQASVMFYNAGTLWLYRNGLLRT